MKTLKTFLTIFRPIQCVTAAAAVIAVAAIATGNLMPSTQVLAASGSMALLVLAGSLFHCAFQNHNHPFTRRVNDYVRYQRPYLWGTMAFLAFQGSISLTVYYLPVSCTIATVLAGGLVVLYTVRRGINAPLNSMVALICTTPVFVGWTASGVLFSGTTTFLLVVAFWLYFLREEVKDHQEKPGIALRSWLDGGPGHDFLLGSLICTGAIHMWAILILKGHDWTEPSVLFACLGWYLVYAFVAGSAHIRRLYPQGILTLFSWLYMAIAIPR